MRFVEQFYLIIHVFILVKRNKMFLQGKKKTPSAPTKGFWFVSADIPLKALCFPLKCRALGHETPILGIVDMEPHNYCTALPHMF